MVLFEWAIRKLGSATSSQYLNITPLHGYMAQKGLNVEIGTGLMREYDYDENDHDPYESEGRRIFGVLGIINIFPISYL